MKIVLRSDVSGVGKKGDICEVADGYGRNYLFPRGMAFAATDGVVVQAASMRRSRDVKDATDRASAEEIARKLVPTVINIKVRAGGEGRLFGSVTAGDVVDAVAAQTGISLDRKKLHMSDHIKATGTHSVPVKLHSDVEFVVTVDVSAS
jgi:large subunit ribosomal protein L9